MTGAQGADLTIRNLKEAAANAFTTAIDTAAEVVGYNGAAAAASESGLHRWCDHDGSDGCCH